jgi:hypothetical protein
MLIAVTFLACSGLHAQDLKNYILAERSGGVIEVMDPVTLQSISQVRFDVRNTAGLNGVAASADGTTLYVEGPITDSSRAAGSCCFLYSIDLATLHAEKVAGVWGSHSREAFVVSGGIVHRASDLSAAAAIRGTGNDRLYLDQAGQALFGVRSFQGPALDVYDLT